jgi:hypothetical protein
MQVKLEFYYIREVDDVLGKKFYWNTSCEWSTKYVTLCLNAINIKLIRYQFWCTRCAFRLIKSRQWYSGRKSWKSQKCENYKRAKKTKYCAMKLSQIRQKIELCMREIILRFEMNFKKKLLFSWQNYLYSYFKQVPKYLATGLKRPSGTNSPPAEASTQGLKYKTNTIPILMHQMRISTNQVSVMSFVCKV